MGTRQQDTTTSEQLTAAATAFADLLRSVPDAGAIAAPTTWTIAETAAHVVGDVTGTADLAESGSAPVLGDGPAWRRGREANARQLEEIPDRDPVALADAVVAATERAVRALAAADGPVWSTNGLLWTPEQTRQVLLGELLVHGHDVARAARRPWTIARADALEVATGSLSLLPSYLEPVGDPQRRLAFELRLRGGAAYRLDVDGDTATVGPAQGRVDCVISADPATFVLVGYGRMSPVTAAVRGGIVARGRKPWLGLKFGKLFAQP